jgi:hypothetical protein
MNPKYTRFQDIPQFTRSGNYEVDVSWDYLEQHLAQWAAYKGCPLVLDPDFQRGHVWDEKKQRGYVEYILRGGNSSRLLYWNCAGWMRGFDSPIELVDGKQRMEAARKFMRNELVIFDSCHFSDFTDQMRMTGPRFRFQMNDLKTRAEVLQWYLDLNTGGVVHTDDEISKVERMLAEEKAKA